MSLFTAANCANHNTPRLSHALQCQLAPQGRGAARCPTSAAAVQLIVVISFVLTVVSLYVQGRGLIRSKIG